MGIPQIEWSAIQAHVDARKKSKPVHQLGKNRKKKKQKKINYVRTADSSSFIKYEIALI